MIFVRYGKEANEMCSEISQADFAKLLKLIKKYEAESHICAKNKAFHGACILLGSALEGCILAMCYVYPEELERIEGPQKAHH